MKRLYCPWRKQYSKEVNGTKKEGATSDECVFCAKLSENDDEKNYIIKRFAHCAVLLNLFPYNAGHVLVIPYRHVACLSDLSEAERAEIMEVVSKAVECAKDALQAQGINVGLNLGRAAGAGIPSHLHMHVLPRWTGDTNFMPLIADSKTVSFDLNEIYQTLKKAFANLP